MSRTSNNIALLTAFAQVVNNESHLQDYIADTARNLSKQGKSFKDNPEEFTDALVAERLEVFDSSSAGRLYRIKMLGVDISDDLKESGIKAEDLSRTEIRQLQQMKVFSEHYHSGSSNSFADILSNARDNLYGHTQGGRDADGKPMEGRELPPTMLYSMAFGGGRGVGLHEPSEEQLITDMTANESIQEVLGKVSEAHDAFYKSQGLGDRAKLAVRSLSERLKNELEDAAPKAMKVAFITAAYISAGMMLGGPDNGAEKPYAESNTVIEQPVYSIDSSDFPPDGSSYNANIKVSSGQTASELASDLLRSVGVAPSTQNIHAMLDASNIPDPDVIYANTIVDMKLPVTDELTPQQTSNLLEVADNITYGGNRLMTSAVKVQAEKAFLDNLSSKKGEEYSM